MSPLIKRAAINYYKQEIIKEAAKRALYKDFLGGVDPTGTLTFKYGIQDTDKPKKERSMRRNLGVAGGVIGGGLAVPSVISGIMGLGRGVAGLKSGKGFKNILRQGWKGFKAPVGGLIRGVAARRGLSRLSQGKSPGSYQRSSINKILKEVTENDSARAAKDLYRRLDDTGLLGSIRGKVGLSGKGADLAKSVATMAGVNPKVQAKTFLKDPKIEHLELLLKKSPEARKLIGALKTPIDSRIKGALGAIGLSGAITGVSSYSQYGQGNRLGQYISRRNRRKAFNDR